MKKKPLSRIIGIGIFHTVLYLFVVPFVIYPKFGDDGIKFTVVVAILISVATFGTMFLDGKNKRRKK